MGIHHHQQRAIHSIQTFTQWVVGKIMLWLLVPFSLCSSAANLCVYTSLEAGNLQTWPRVSHNVVPKLTECTGISAFGSVS